MQNGAVTLEKSVAVPQNLKIVLLYDLAFLFLGIYPIEKKNTSTQTLVHKVHSSIIHDSQKV